MTNNINSLAYPGINFIGTSLPTNPLSGQTALVTAGDDAGLWFRDVDSWINISNGKYSGSGMVVKNRFIQNSEPEPNVTVTPEDYGILCNLQPGSVVITLPDVSTVPVGKTYLIGGGNDLVNTWTLKTNDGSVINVKSVIYAGLATFSPENYPVQFCLCEPGEGFFMWLATSYFGGTVV